MKTVTLKVILLGSQNAGKTSILNRYIKGVFYEKATSTVGVDFATKLISKVDLASSGTTTQTPMGGFGDSGLLTGEDIVL